MSPDRKAMRSSNRTAVSQSWRSKLPSLRMRFSHFGRTKEIGTAATKDRVPVRLRARRTSIALGRVDGFDDDEAQSECDEGSEVPVRFLATERNALEALELADEVFDAGA